MPAATDDQRAALVSKHNLREGKISATESLIGVMRAVNAVGKDGRNAQQGFNFRGIDAVINAVGPALREVGGVIVPRLVSVDYEHGLTAKGGSTVEVKLAVEYAWHGTDGGEPITAVVCSEAMDMSDKATAKAWSVAYRTYLLQILCLPTDDPDPDSEYIERGASTRKPATPPQQKIAAQKSVPTSQDWAARITTAKTVADLGVIYKEAESLGELNSEYEPGSGVVVGELIWKVRRALEAQAGGA